MVGEIGADLNAFKKLQRPVWLTTHAENIQFEACDRQALEIDRLLGSCKDSLMKSTSPLSVPLLRNVDILVVGGSIFESVLLESVKYFVLISLFSEKR